MATRTDTLPEQTAEQMKRESDALRRIAVLLGAAENWDGGADYFLDDIADIVYHEAGMPNPCHDANTTFYQAVR